jgi:hypothetical protein
MAMRPPGAQGRCPGFLRGLPGPGPFITHPAIITCHRLRQQWRAGAPALSSAVPPPEGTRLMIKEMR